MDNDKRYIKIIKKLIKEAKFKWDYKDLCILKEHIGNEEIKHRIQGRDPFTVVRGGATEMRCIAEYLRIGRFSDQIQVEMKTLSGFFPTDSNSLMRFCELYMDAISQADMVSLWGVGAESKVVHERCNNSVFTELHALEPYYFSQPWSAELKGKKVLVIHPFKTSIEKQYIRREKLFPESEILPEFDKLTCIQAVQSIAGAKTSFSSWFDALEYMKRQIDSSDFDIAIIGAGAYGLPLAVYCKQIGKQAVQMSGATQILFGIKGKRWDNHPVISKLYNDSWIRPDQTETPSQTKIVEGGSYW